LTYDNTKQSMLKKYLRITLDQILIPHSIEETENGFEVGNNGETKIIIDNDWKKTEGKVQYNKNDLIFFRSLIDRSIKEIRNWLTQQVSKTDHL